MMAVKWISMGQSLTMMKKAKLTKKMNGLKILKVMALLRSQQLKIDHKMSNL